MKRSPLKPGSGFKSQSFARSDAKEASAVAKIRDKRCAVKSCRQQFTPDRPFITWCSQDCGVVVIQGKVKKARAAQEAARKRAEKAERAETKRRKESGKKRTEWISEAQTAFNAWVRYRDRDQPCICCGATVATQGAGGGWDAGHWISRGHASHLRFDERNVHKQRKGCNRPGGTTRARYRIGLVERIGEEAVQALEALEYAPSEKKWSVEECKEIIARYREKLKELKGQA